LENSVHGGPTGERGRVRPEPRASGCLGWDLGAGIFLGSGSPLWAMAMGPFLGRLPAVVARSKGDQVAGAGAEWAPGTRWPRPSRAAPSTRRRPRPRPAPAPDPARPGPARPRTGGAAHSEPAPEPEPEPEPPPGALGRPRGHPSGRHCRSGSERQGPRGRRGTRGEETGRDAGRPGVAARG
jgi:hypothetical protein